MHIEPYVVAFMALLPGAFAPRGEVCMGTRDEIEACEARKEVHTRRLRGCSMISTTSPPPARRHAMMVTDRALGSAECVTAGAGCHEECLDAHAAYSDLSE